MQSRNQREGRYAGKYIGQHFRTSATYKFFPPPQHSFIIHKLERKLSRIKMLILQSVLPPSMHQNQSSL